MSGGGLLLILGLLVVMYFLLIRPQRNRQRQQQSMINELEVGSEILTAGGLYGEVAWIDEDEIGLEIAPETTVRVSAVTSILRSIVTSL